MKARKQKAHRFGIAAEKYAGAYLACKGYRILADRYRNHLGEIDLLARKGKTLVAVEVKARRTFAECSESVPPAKQQKIARALEGFLAGLAAHSADNIRFDVIWVVPWRLPRHIKDAWRL